MKFERKHATIAVVILCVIAIALIMHYPREVADVDVEEPVRPGQLDSQPEPGQDEDAPTDSEMKGAVPPPKHVLQFPAPAKDERQETPEEASYREAQEMADPGPDPRDEEPTGSIPKEEIQLAVEKVKPFLKSCYENSLVDFPEASGRIVVEFELESEGGTTRPSQAQVLESESTLLDDRLNACLSKTIGDIEIPSEVEGGGKVVVRYPFTFEPAEKD